MRRYVSGLVSGWFRIAHEFKIDPVYAATVLSQRWTYPQYCAVLEWLGAEWNRPSRADHYVMQLTAKVQEKFSSSAVDPNDMKLEFKTEEELEKDLLRPMTPEEIEASKARWRAVGARPASELRDV